MISKKTIEECEVILKRSFLNINPYVMKQHWTDYEDTNLVVNLLMNCNSILELGTYKGHTTENIANYVQKCSRLVTVDIVKEKHNIIPQFQSHELLSEQESGMIIENSKVEKVISTTDEFFEKNTETFDGIFIDASHDYDQVLRDSKNSIKILNSNGIIVWHDVYNHDNSCPKCQAEPQNDGVIRALEDLPYDIIKAGKSWIAFLIL